MENINTLIPIKITKTENGVSVKAIIKKTSTVPKIDTKKVTYSSNDGITTGIPASEAFYPKLLLTEEPQQNNWFKYDTKLIITGNFSKGNNRAPSHINITFEYIEKDDKPETLVSTLRLQ